MTARITDMIEKFFVSGDPLVVSASTLLASGGSALLDQELLANDYDRSRAFLIDTIRFQVVTPDWSAFMRQGPLFNGTNLGGTMRVTFSLGRHQLSRVPIPIALFSPPRDGTVAFNYFPPTIASYESVYREKVSSREFNCHFEWTLPRPLLVPANMVLEARAVRSNDGFPADLTLNVCYLGRLAKKPVPSSIPVAIPYVGLFERDLSTPGVYTSGQHDLWNPFTRELRVQRFVGRLQTLFRQTVAEAAAENAAGVLDAGTQCILLDYEPEAINLFTGVYVSGGISRFPPTQLRRFDGQNMTLGLQPGISVFDGYRRSFPGDAVLAPRQGYEATIDARSDLPPVGSLGANTAFISMVGWREESL